MAACPIWLSKVNVGETVISEELFIGHQGNVTGCGQHFPPIQSHGYRFDTVGRMLARTPDGDEADFDWYQGVKKRGFNLK